MTPRFVVGTGRCGSTLLSELLAAHPAVLSASEVLSMVQPAAFPGDPIDGERFWRLLSEPRDDMTVLLRRGAEPDEVRYPVDGAGRFDRDSGVPPILLICLPSLTDDPDALFDELEGPIRALPAASVGTHYRSLLDRLAATLGRQLWVERSGGSLDYAGDIVRHFDRPKIVHLHRDGVETALSMSRHPSWRFAMVRALGGSFDAQTFRELPLPLELFGRTWSATILRGTRQLAALPAGDVGHLSYERLVADPRAALAAVADRLELPDPGGAWRERAVRDVAVASGRRHADALPEEELERLRHACAPGERRLRRLAAADPV